MLLTRRDPARSLWMQGDVSARILSQIKYVLIFLGWTFLATISGAIVGLASIVLSPTGVFGLIAIPALLLLWALPDSPKPRSIWVRRLFYAMVVVYLCIPFYYTIQIPSLPWISARRIVAFPLIITSALAISGSPDVRRRLVSVASTSSAIIYPAIAFYMAIFISIPFSINPLVSIGQFADATLTWFIPLLTVIQVIEREDDIQRLVSVLSTCAVVITLLGLAEFVSEHRFLVDIFPKWMLENLIESNPTLSDLINGSPFRNGFYRASSVYSVSLSFGEYEATMAPFGLYYIFHGKNWKLNTFGWIIFIFSCVGIFASGARGGYMSLLLGSSLFIILYSIWAARFEKHSLVPVISVIVGLGILTVVIILIIVWPRAHNLVFGDGMAAYSTDSRYQQWDLAAPQILRSPIFGLGFAQGAEVVGYRTPGGNLSLDSYVISLLTETGIFGFISFSTMLLMAIFISAGLYLREKNPINQLMGAFSCSIFAFGFYRLALSQRENHIVLFVLIGIVAVVKYQRSSLNMTKSMQSA